MAAQEPATPAVTSFEEQLQHARELVMEGRRLLHVANRDLRTGTLLVRQSHQRLHETAGIFRRLPPSTSTLN